MTFKIAFFKGKTTIWGRLIRWWDNGPYNHCEIVFSDGMWGSALAKGGGVVLRRPKVKPSDFDYIELPAHLEPAARAWFESHLGKSYDFKNILRFILDFLPASRDKWICSSACSDALGLAEGWRKGPNTLYAEIKNALAI